MLPYPTDVSSKPAPERGVFTSILKKNLPKKLNTASKQEQSGAKKSNSIIEPLINIKTERFEADKKAEDAEIDSLEIQEDILETGSRDKFEPLPIANIINPQIIPESGSSLLELNEDFIGETGTESLRKNADLDERADDLLEFGAEQGFDLPDIDLAARDIEIDPDDLLDTGQLFELDGEFTAPERESPDVLALPELEFDFINSVGVARSSNGIAGLELDLESTDEVNLATSIPKIELDLAGIDDVSLPSEEFKDDEVLETPDAEIEKGREMRVIEPIDVTPDKVNAPDQSAWQERSSDVSDPEESRWFLYPLVGVIILALGIFGYFYLTSKNQSTDETASISNNSAVNQAVVGADNSQPSVDNSQPANEELIPPAGNPVDFNNQMSPAESGIAPPPRNIKQPPNTRLYKNEKRNQKGALSEKFLGFSIYFPKDWKRNKSDNKFLDIAKKAPDGLPIKQLLISQYDSRGTFELDRELFKDLVKTSNADLRKILDSYQVISEGEDLFQDGRWKTYEVKFQGIGSDKKLIIWGRRLWIPVQRPGMTSGFIITMIGTSLSRDLKSVADLGVNDDLAEILRTFEPDLK